MGLRGEIFSNKVALPNRTYFFNIKENRMGDLYLNIVESKNKETGGFDRQSLVLFADDLQEFLAGFDESLKVLEKNVREKRRQGRNGAAPGRMPREPGRGDGHRGESHDRPRGGQRDDRPRGGSRDGRKYRPKDRSGDRPRDRKPYDAQGGSGGPSKNRKVVVRKNRDTYQD